MSSLEEDSSESSIHGRFWDSSSDSRAESEVDLPTIAQWRLIKDSKRKRHLKYTLSHPNKMAATSAWSWTLKQYGQVSPGCHTSDMAEVFYDCLKVRNKRSSACCVLQSLSFFNFPNLFYHQISAQQPQPKRLISDAIRAARGASIFTSNRNQVFFRGPWCHSGSA